jgi:hypothetical protein
VVRHGVEQRPSVRWWPWLAALAVVRVGVPLLVLGAGSTKLPLLPTYEWRPFRGDLPSYLGTAQALLDGWRALGVATSASAVALVAVVAVVAAAGWRLGWWWRLGGVLLVALSTSIAFATAIAEMPQAPAGAIGWPLVWSLPLRGLRALGLDDVDTWVYASSVVVSVAANVVTLVAIAYAARSLTERHGVGLLAAGLYAWWPVLSGLIGGKRTAENGQWAVEAGLIGYSEPLSTMCIAVGTALLVSRGLTPMRCALAGIALGYAVVVRPPNGLLAALALLFLLARRNVPGAAAYVGGGLAVLPLYLAFLPKKTGYELVTEDPSGPLFALEFVDQSWLHSTFWHPRTLAILLPFAAAGAYTLGRRWSTAFLVASILAVAAFYSTFRVTEYHPRYLLAALPALLVLVAAGLAYAGKEFVRTSTRLSGPR